MRPPAAQGVQAVPLETLADSPLVAGAHLRRVELTPNVHPAHYLHIVGDSAAALELRPEDEDHFARLVTETGAPFGAGHYRDYHFPLTNGGSPSRRGSMPSTPARRSEASKAPAGD